MNKNQPMHVKSTLIKALMAAALVTQMSACVPVVVGGAAAGGAMAADRRTPGIYIEDQDIEIKAAKKFAELGEDAHINVTSYNRNVLLTGETPNAKAKARAAALTKEVTNVRTITNEIAIGPKSSLSSRSSDTYLTSKVKAKFLAENKFPANYVKVVTENSVVYLLGIVTKEEAEAAVSIASKTDGVSKVVKVFEYIPKK